MKIVADLHIHSKYSRAVSPKMEILEIGRWARKKGIDVVATGDWTHPLWLREIKANLEEDGTGLLKLRVRGSGFREERPLFLLSTEISSIYSQGGKGRRVHTLIFAPSISVVEKINKELTNRGANLLSDGRPIIGLSAKDLAELVLGVDKNCLIVPAHIWTPWFALFGSMSGFDSIEECFGNMSQYIYGIETGLSSDPVMNWRIKELDNRAILSFSDAHSGPKLGREVTVFKIKNEKLCRRKSRAPKSLDDSSLSRIRRTCSIKTSAKSKNTNKKLKISYNDIARAIKNDRSCDWEIAHTIEFYPEEGKYHYTGHRNCQVRQSPEETKRLGATCPACGRRLTVGVMHRVEQLAVRPLKTENLKLKIDKNEVRWIGYENRSPYVSLVPLLEILSEALGSAPTTLKVQNEYENLTSKFGEFDILLKTPIEEIVKISGERVAEGIKKVRSGDIVVEPGYDGVFGKVKIWREKKSEEAKEEKKQLSLF